MTNIVDELDSEKNPYKFLASMLMNYVSGSLEEVATIKSAEMIEDKTDIKIKIVFGNNFQFIYYIPFHSGTDLSLSVDEMPYNLDDEILFGEEVEMVTTIDQYLKNTKRSIEFLNFLNDLNTKRRFDYGMTYWNTGVTIGFENHIAVDVVLGWNCVDVVHYAYSDYIDPLKELFSDEQLTESIRLNPDMNNSVLVKKILLSNSNEDIFKEIMSTGILIDKMCNKLDYLVQKSKHKLANDIMKTFKDNINVN